MTALLTASPNPAAPSSTVVASGTGFTNSVKTRLVLGSKVMTGQFYATSGAFNVPIQIPATVRVTQTLLAQQKPGKAWTFVAGVTLIVQTAPPAPKMVGTPTVDAITTTTTTITWTLDQPSTGQIEYGPVTSPQTYPFLTTLEPNYYTTHSQDLTGLSAGTFYAFRVLSGNANGSITLVSRTFGTLAAAATVPGAPTGLTAVGGDTTVDLAWVTPASNGGSAITGYQVLRAAALIATVGVVNVFHDVGRTNGVSYAYTVKAVNAVGASTASGSASATPAASGVTFPPDRNPVTYVAVPTAPSLPGYLSAVVDPTWLTHIKRISNTRGVRHAYSRYQPWSKDGDFIMLPYTGSGQTPRLIDGTTYADIGTFSPPNMAVWSNTVNDRMFGVTGNQLIRKTMAGTTTVVHTFSGYSTISLGEYEGGISDDDKYVALIGDPGGSAHLIVYRIDTDAIIADIAVGTSIGDCQISRLGNYVTAATGTGLRRYVQDLSSYITLYGHYSHGDNALNAAGAEIFVARGNTSPETIKSWRLSDGQATTLLSGSVCDAGHYSGHHGRNGWIYLSNYDPNYYGASSTKPGKDQVLALKADGSGTCEVFAFAHHARPPDATYNAMSGPDQMKIYSQEPHAAASRDGSKVIFASEWASSPTAWSFDAPYAFVASV